MQYESLLANERVTNERLQETLLAKNTIDKLMDEGSKCTYTEYAKTNSMFRLDGGRKSAFEDQARPSGV